jgi:flagellar biosynthesis protein FlhG
MKVMHHQHGTKNFFLLPNMVADEQEAKAVYENISSVTARFMGGISIEYAGFIPYDRNLPHAVSRRTPVICSHPRGLAGTGFRNLARDLIKQNEHRPVDGSIKFFWKRLMDVSCG